MRGRALQLPAIGNERMTAEMFIDIRRHLGLKQDEMARCLCYGAKTRIAEIENGTSFVPGRVKLLMLAYASGWRPPLWDKMVSGEVRER